MYKLCKTEQSAARQRSLEQGLLAVMKEVSFQDISVQDLCRQLGVTRKSFYRYFSGKEGALHALIDHTLMEMEWPYLSGDSQSIHRELTRFFCFWKNKKPFLSAIADSGLESTLIRCAVEQALGERKGDTHTPPQALPPENYGTIFGTCGLMSVVLTWHHRDYLTPPEQMAVLAVRLITQPLLEKQ